MRNWVILIVLGLFSCQSKSPDLEILLSFPKHLHEVSGIQIKDNCNYLYVIEDSGNDSSVYEVSFDGKQKRELHVKAQNMDWEDLASDNQGNLYLGDFGNNDNDRRDLCIYKINPTAKNDSLIPEYKVTFNYPEQTVFPPKKKDLLYDCEAFFEFKGYFYLFTKNRSKGFDGTTLIYKIPNKEGHHAAQLLGKYKTGEDYNDSAITGAAISPDGTKFVLLSHSKVWLFEKFNGDDFLNGTISVLSLNHYSQKEAVCFKDNNTLFVADEREKKSGGMVYVFDLKSLEAKP